MSKRRDIINAMSILSKKKYIFNINDEDTHVGVMFYKKSILILNLGFFF